MTDKTLTGVFLWLKSLSPSMKLEWLLPEFETRGFRSRRSLAYVQTEDLDSFFPSPTKLLLAERCILEAEHNKIKAENNGQSTQREPKRLNVLPSASTTEELMRATSQSTYLRRPPAALVRSIQSHKHFIALWVEEL